MQQLPGLQLEMLQTTNDSGLPVEQRESSRASSSGSAGTALAATSPAGPQAAGGSGSTPTGSSSSDGIQQQQQRRRRTVLVVFIGGVTHAEVAALRFLSSKGLVEADFLVAATSVCTGSSLLAPLLAGSGGSGAIDPLPPPSAAEA